jgi:prepilin-type N-terminal cleavage/methylation domain-containing protein
MVNNKLMLKKGFTLVELLIVIALLGAIAVIVIAAINPIEQANKARDAKYSADSSQLVSAMERYYASNSKFPWQVTNPTLTAEDEFSFVNARDLGVGLCGTSACNDQTGTLISTDELKSEFLTRDWIKSANAQSPTLNDQQILVGKGTGSSSSIYACFVPKAKSTKDKAVADGRVRTDSFTAAGIPSDGSCTLSSDNWAANKCLVCVPE